MESSTKITEQSNSDVSEKINDEKLNEMNPKILKR